MTWRMHLDRKNLHGVSWGNKGSIHALQELFDKMISFSFSSFSAWYKYAFTSINSFHFCTVVSRKTLNLSWAKLMLYPQRSGKNSQRPHYNAVLWYCSFASEKKMHNSTKHGTQLKCCFMDLLFLSVIKNCTNQRNVQKVYMQMAPRLGQILMT